MASDPNLRDLEDGLVRSGRDLTYGEYLHLDEVLGAQHPLSRPVQHDELLFIIQHQTSELWMKLIVHELLAALDHLAADAVQPALKGIARVKAVQATMAEQWSVLATLTPSEYATFRPFLGQSSGFQSSQYRTIEFLLGNKDAGMLSFFTEDADATGLLTAALERPSLYDEVLRLLARRGLPVPRSVLDRDVTRAHTFDTALLPLFRGIYEDPTANWEAYEVCEELVDLEDNFQTWRFRHLRTVQRIIGSGSPGTGGSSGVSFLRRALDLTFFPELFAVRSDLTALG